MQLAVILVHYRTPDLLKPACDALLTDAEAAGIELEGIVVDNGSTPEDEALLRTLPFRCLDPGDNLGYAGGVNLGFRETAADFVVLMNPDVQVLPGCLAALTTELRGGADAVGPKFYWDHGKRFLLPPTEEVDRRAESLRFLAERGSGWAARARRRWRRHAQRHWLTREPITTFDLSGALLAVRRSAWERVGPFDESYELYFEETDWLQRLRAAGLEARLTPAAEAVHLFAQSTVSEARADSWFLESQRRFRRRVYGILFTRLLETLGNAIEPRVAKPSANPGSDGDSAAWLEISSSSIGYPAAGCPLQAGAGLEPEGLPEEIHRRLAPGSYTLRTVDAAGRELATRTLVKG